MGKGYAKEAVMGMTLYEASIHFGARDNNNKLNLGGDLAKQFRRRQAESKKDG